ncbi:MAG: BufA2 family periplasmic bufferin-type metallophore [Gammaproteobacteria bacterium]
MSTNKKVLSATLATAAAISFAVAPITSAVAAKHTVPCYGVNSCKGKSQCKTAKSSCKGTNSCKGQGYLMKTEKQCKKLGGSTTEPTS